MKPRNTCPGCLCQDFQYTEKATVYCDGLIDENGEFVVNDNYHYEVTECDEVVACIGCGREYPFPKEAN